MQWHRGLINLQLPDRQAHRAEISDSKISVKSINFHLEISLSACVKITLKFTVHLSA